MKKLLLIGCLVAAALGASPAAATAAPGCNLPSSRPLWIDFGDGSVPFWDRIFARPGVVAAASNFIAPPRLRAAGAKTVYWDMYLKNRVGTPTAPADPAVIVDRADRLFLRAVASSGCATPVIALNELFGAGTATPWSDSNARYRSNVLTFLRRLAALGARPQLLISSTPYTAGEAAQWWRDTSDVADLVREVYFSGPRIHKQGPLVGSRTMRVALRKGIEDFTEVGIPPSRLGLMLGFHTTKGVGSGREGLAPSSAWFDVVKLEALAAKQVAAETRITSVWSWGWGVWSVGESDPDKEAAACVWLWARDASLCDAAKVAGPSFEGSRSEARLPPGVQCSLGELTVTRGQLAELARVTGDADSALSALHARLVLSKWVGLTAAELDAAEAAVVAQEFRGSWPAYRAALTRARTSRSLARAIIGFETRESKLRSRMRVTGPSSAAIADYQLTFAESRARPVAAKRRLSWLGGRRSGLALEPVAPAAVFSLPEGKPKVLRTAEGRIQLRATGPTMELGAYPLALARPAITAALIESARLAKFQAWLLARRSEALQQTVCARDELPVVEPVELTDFLPFLALD